jgi:hypothetical protein
VAGKDLTYTVGVDASDATSGLRRLESAVRSTMRTVDDELEEGASAGDKLVASLDRVAAQAKEDLNSAAIAAEELQRALRDAGSNMDVGDALSSLNRMGLSMDEVTADADKLAASLKQLDDVRAQGVSDLDAIAPGLATKLDGVSKSADSSKNALANMVGNSVQDVTGLGGALGVALGQLAEFGADAKLAGEGLGSVFKGLAGVAAPIAGIAIATKAATDVMSRFSASQKRTTESVEMWEAALDSGEDATDAYKQSLAELGKVVLDVTRSQSGLENVVAELDSHWYSTGLGVDLLGKLLGVTNDETKDLTGTLTQAGLDVDRWAASVEGGATELARMEDYLSRTNLSGDEQKDVLTALEQAQEDHAKAAENDAAATAFFGDEAEEAAPSAEELAEKQREATEAAKAHTIAITDAARELQGITSVFAEMGRRGDAIAAVFDLGNAPLDAASATRDIAEGIGELKEVAKGVKLGDILAGNMDGDAVLDELDALRPRIQSKVAEAFAAGGPEAARSVAGDYVAQIVTALGGKLTAQQVEELLGLSDLEATVAVALDMSTAARVRAMLDVLTGLRGASPYTASILLALDAGTLSPEAAEVLVRAQLAGAEVAIPTDVTPPTTEQVHEAGRFVESVARRDPPELATDIDPALAERGVDSFRRDVENDSPAEVPVGADPDTAETRVAGFRRTTENTKAIAPVDSSVAAALITMAYLKVYAALLRPEVTVDADTAGAASEIRGLAGMRPRVPVEAYLADYPSASEIQRAIGRPRIPVDIVVGSSIRITGVRE